MAPLPFPKIRASATDGRLLNAYFRREQLKSLHDTLSKNGQEVRNVLVKDTSVSPAEAAIEYCLALEEIKAHYDALDPVKELEKEYRIAKGQDAGDRREPVGIAYIESEMGHTPFFSIVSPVAAAVASGNCILLRLDNTLRSLPSLIKNLLQQALDIDIFDTTTSTPAPDFLALCVSVLQTPSSQPTSATVLRSNSSARVIAIVDRSADLQAAAESLVTARFAFGGASPYAPDLVFINEYVKKEFLEAVLSVAIRFMSGTNGAINGTANGDIKRKSDKRVQEVLNNLGEKSGVRVITSGDGGAVVDVQKRYSPLFSQKTTSPIFSFHATTSLDASIDLANTHSSLLATYHFADAASARYTSQFIKSDVAFINHIPIELLVGPPSPNAHPFALTPRYNPSLFSLPSPALTTPSASSKSLNTIISSPSSSKVLADYVKSATQELKAEKRPESIATGFFEQGILIGLGMVGIPILTAIGVGVGYGVRAVWMRWR